MATLRARLSYANVMATIAVFVALGGSSYAAIKVTGKSVVNSSLTGKDVKNSSLTGDDVKGGSLLSSDFGTGQLPAGPQGAQGPQGPQGAPGAQGLRGERGPSFGDTAFAVSQSLTACGAGTTVITKSITVPESSRVYAHSQGNFSANASGATHLSLTLTLKSGNTVVASLPTAQHAGEGAADVSGVLSTNANRSAGHNVPPGTYDLAVQATMAGAACPDPQFGTAQMTSNTLSFILLGT
jgi:hypothetical protein